MSAVELTPKNLRAAKPGDVLRDSKISGLHVRVFQNRSSYYLYYRTKEGKERKPKLGDHPILTIDDARKVAKQLLAEVALGGDPSAERQAARSAPTIADLCDRYRKEYAPNKKSAYKDDYLIDRFVLAHFGANTHVSSVTHSDCAKLHSKLESTPRQANMVRALLSTMFNLAEVWEMRPRGSNPAKHVRCYKEKKRRRIATPQEAMAIAGHLATYETQRPEAVLFLWLLIFTGARPSEIARAKFSDLNGNKIELTEHKTDGKVDMREIYLPTFLVTKLRFRPRRADGLLVGIQSPRKLWDEIRAKAGCPDLWMYDLRRTYASIALQTGYSLAQIGELFQHQSTQTTSRYAWLAANSKQEMAEDMAAELNKMFSCGSSGV